MSVEMSSTVCVNIMAVCQPNNIMDQIIVTIFNILKIYQPKYADICNSEDLLIFNIIQ